MTIHAQLPLAPSPQLPIHHTLSIEAPDAPVLDAFALLDHRTRATVLPETGAPPGRYLALEDGGLVRLLPLNRSIIHVGRGLVADLRLDHPQVSRRHAIIAQWANRARVLDDRSSNGTFVNGRCITVADLYDGDVVRFGMVALRYVEIAPLWKTPPLRRVPSPLHAEGEPLGPVAA
jgi:pSer/pThr/pTyr-binding forkhead associated (FHA) protein